MSRAMASWLIALSRAPQRGLMFAVRGYRLLLSPWLGNACRFEPTCSAYALEALDRHGAAAGSYLTLHRLARCNPLCDGGHDPVPAAPLFRGLARRGPRTPTALSNPLTDKTSP